jgi:HD-GYP domain-containing protein (c-di-GMP phosphodiesterase class II)
MGSAASASGLRLAELVGTLSLSADLGLGQPLEHVTRSCLVAVRLGELLGLDAAQREVTYYSALLAWVGCTADSHEVAVLFGDDVALRAASYDVDFAGLPLLGFLVRHAGAGSPPLTRARAAARVLATGGRAIEGALAAHCQVTGRLADRLGLGGRVQRCLGQSFARWDGTGHPSSIAGEALELPTRLVHLADLVEVYHRRGGVPAAIDVARRRSGTQLDPQLVEAFLSHATELLDDLSIPSAWDALIAADPSPRTLLGDQLDAALEAVADFVDLKSPYFAGHSRGVADLAAAAARRAGHPEPDVQTLRRAGLLHDFGRTGVPNTIWDKPGPLTELEWERVRLHSYYTDRMLRRPPLLAELGVIAALAHERLDGSGYHRGLTGTAIPALARLLGAADCYHAMREARPHRPPHPPEAAARQLRAMARAGALDPTAVEAVLGSAGHRPRRAAAGPAGLTPREVEVLVLLARAASTRQIAHRLGIAPKTAGNHIERIYTKIGASTRAAAALYAMQHGLLRTLDPLEPHEP